MSNVPLQGHFHHSDPFVAADRLIVPSSVESNRMAGGVSGVTADPTVATREKGEIYHQRLMDNLVAALQDIVQLQIDIKKIPEVKA